MKYLYGQALTQSHKPQKLAASVSILLFHDAVEAFLHLALEHHDAIPRQLPDFLGYWKLLGVANCRLDGPGPLKRFNDVRVALKHRGIDPSWEQIESARLNVTSFFQASTPRAFPSLTFDGISLAAMVLYDEPRSHLENAERSIAESRYDDALGEIAYALEKLLVEYDERATDPIAGSPFSVGPTPRHVGSRVRLYDVSDLSAHAEHQALRETAEAVRRLQTQMKVIVLGLDYRRYSRFLRLVPTVVWISAGTPQLQRAELVRNNPTLEECSFCFDFVIDSALRLQEAEFGPA